MANIENMKLTLALLERLKAQKKPFTLEVWKVFPDNLGLHNRIRVFGSASPGPECGFAACVGGWMMSDPDHQELGVRQTSYGEPLYGQAAGYRAMASFWGVPVDQAEHIGNVDRHPVEQDPTIDDAVGRLRELITLHSPQHETA
jgi:hypothetical protein